MICVCQEGKQASLAADFSVTQFKHLGRLLMVHGRNSYKRSAALSQFVIHRSLCISTMQVEYNINTVPFRSVFISRVETTLYLLKYFTFALDHFSQQSFNLQNFDHKSLFSFFPHIAHKMKTCITNKVIHHTLR